MKPINLLRAAALSVGIVLASNAAAATPLTVYAAMGYDQHVVQAFTAATGIPVNLVHLSTGPLLARVQAEGARPQWDVLWFDGNLAMHALADRHLLACGQPPKVDYTPMGKALAPADGCYAPVGITYANVMLINTARLPRADWPAAWQDLAGPKLRGKVGMNNPAISGPTYPFVAGMLQALGATAGKAYFEHLKANGLHVYPTNSVTLGALRYGQIDVAVVQSSAAIGFAQDNPGMRIVSPGPATALPSDIAIGAGVRGQVLAEARRFEAFVLSAAGQRALQAGDPSADSNYLPLVRGVAPLPALAKVKTGPALVLDPAVWGGKEPDVVGWFTAHVVR